MLEYYRSVAIQNEDSLARFYQHYVWQLLPRYSCDQIPHVTEWVTRTVEVVAVAHKKSLNRSILPSGKFVFDDFCRATVGTRFLL